MDKDNNDELKKCILCPTESTENYFLNLHNSVELTISLKRLNLEIIPLKGQIDWVCFQCSYKLSIITDCTKGWEQRIVRSRANYYYQLGDKEMVRRLLSSYPKSAAENTVPVLTLDPPARSLSARSLSARSLSARTTSASSADNERNEGNSMEANNQFKWKLNNPIPCLNMVMIPGTSQIQIRNEAQSSDNQNTEQVSERNDQALLTVMHEESESVLATESGGQINGYYTKQRSMMKSVTFQCKYCPRTFTRPSYFMKHEKKHDRKTPSVRSTRSLMVCPDCGITFNKAVEYKKHAPIHQTKMKCSYCPKEYTVLNDFNMHEAECFGKFCANNKGPVARRYMTRSVKKLGIKKTVTSRTRGTTEDEVSIADSTFTARQRNISSWIRQTSFDSFDEYSETEYLNDDSDDEDDSESFFSAFTRASSHVNTCDVADQNSSVKGSKAKKRLQNMEIKKPDNKKSKLGYKTAFLCPDLSCNFTAYDIKILLEHDITVHEELPLFRCKKCNGRFLRKCYFEYHTMNQDPGRYTCHKCVQQFSRDCDFKNHLQLHKNTESHICVYCNFRFLNETNWKKHIITPNHFQRKEFFRNTIFIVKNSYPILGNQLLLQIEEENAKKIIVKPYKSEFRIRNFLEPESRRTSSKYPIWKPGEINIKGYNGYLYPDCAARPYK